MQIWVDADACPQVIKEIVYRAAERTRVTAILVANQPLRTPPSKYLKTIQVASGYDVADNEIVQRLRPKDLVITSDIPLAAEIIEKGGMALSPRGEEFTRENIGGRLNMRDFMETLRSSGIQSGGPKTMTQSDRMAFANKLDSLLARHASKS